MMLKIAQQALSKLTLMYGSAARCKRDESSASGAAVLRQCIRRAPVKPARSRW